MKINYRHVLKVISLPLALYLLFPVADPHQWLDFSLERLWMCWRELLPFSLLFVQVFPVVGIIEFIFLARWAVKPCLRTGVWLTIMMYLPYWLRIYFDH